MTREEFKQLTEEMLPIAEMMMHVLKKHGVKKHFSATINGGGYCYFSIYADEYAAMKLPGEKELEIL